METVLSLSVVNNSARSNRSQTCKNHILSPRLPLLPQYSLYLRHFIPQASIFIEQYTTLVNYLPIHSKTFNYVSRRGRLMTSWVSYRFLRGSETSYHPNRLLLSHTLRPSKPKQHITHANKNTSWHIPCTFRFPAVCKVTFCLWNYIFAQFYLNYGLTNRPKEPVR